MDDLVGDTPEDDPPDATTAGSNHQQVSRPALGVGQDHLGGFASLAGKEGSLGGNAGLTSTGSGSVEDRFRLVTVGTFRCDQVDAADIEQAPGRRLNDMDDAHGRMLINGHVDRTTERSLRARAGIDRHENTLEHMDSCSIVQ